MPIHHLGSVTENPLAPYFRALGLAVALACFVIFAPHVAHARHWDPARTWVFVVGTLEWQNPDDLPSFPKKKRRDAQLVRFFQKAGVAEDQLVYLQDAEATMEAIARRLHDFLPRAQEGDLLIVYYCGHGYPSAEDPKRIMMASYDASAEMQGWSYESLVKTIERRFKGGKALLLSDCCHSGGAIPAVKKYRKRVSFATLGSSPFSEESTGNWTFTEALLAAFRGSSAADLNQDGAVTLGETQRFIRGEMRFGEDQETSWILPREVWRDFVIADAKPRTHPRIGAHAEVKADGEWWKARVTAARGEEFKVFYYGYEQSDSEWVTEDRIRWKATPPERRKGSESAPAEETEERPSGGTFGSARRK